MEMIFPDLAADIATKLAILILALSFHEFAHAISAHRAGDDTAKLDGRVTLNPLKHIELFNTVVLPGVLLAMTRGQWIIGGAKPTPVNEARLSSVQSLLVTMAGPASNVLFGGVAFALLLVLAPYVAFGSLPYLLLTTTIYINALLVLFNMLPIPGLDGAELVRFVLPQPLKRAWEAMGRYGFGMVIMIALMVAIWYHYLDISAFINLLDAVNTFVQDTFLSIK